MLPPRKLPKLAVAALLVSACHGSEKKSLVALSSANSATASVLQPGDIRIVTQDSGADLALLGDTISAGLSVHTLDKVKKETDTTAVKGDGFGASIEKMVKGAVQKGIGTRTAAPLAAVRDVHIDNGTIVFDWVGTPYQLMSNSHENGKAVLASFAPADAQAFVDAVRARKRAPAQQ